MFPPSYSIVLDQIPPLLISHLSKKCKEEVARLKNYDKMGQDSHSGQ